MKQVTAWPVAHAGLHVVSKGPVSQSPKNAWPVASSAPVATTAKKPETFRSEMQDLLNSFFRTLPTQFVANTEALLDKYHGKR